MFKIKWMLAWGGMVYCKKFHTLLKCCNKSIVLITVQQLMATHSCLWSRSALKEVWKSLHVCSILCFFSFPLPLGPASSSLTQPLFFSMCSDQFSCSVVSDSLWPHGLQHTRLPCPSPTTGVYSNSCPLSRWCHPTISSSVIPFSACLQSFPASESFPMSQFFTSGGQSIGVSASVLPMNIQDWFPLGLTGLISLHSKRFSRVFSNTTLQKHQFFSTQLSL